MPSSRKAGRPGRSAVIFDRDGVLNVDHGYVGDPENIEWVDGARRAVRRLNESGVLVIVATNQSGVARGLFDMAAVESVHAVMQADLTVDGARIDAFYICPFLPDAVEPAFAHHDHPDRKPNPGMLLRALDEWDIDPARCVMVGDKASDLEAARRAGIAAALFQGGNLDDFLKPLIPRETKRNRKLVVSAGATSLTASAMLPFIDLAAQQARIRPALDVAIAKVLAHGAYVMGPEVRAFRRPPWPAFGEADSALACANGTDALALPLMAWGSRRGRRGILPVVHLCRDLRGDSLVRRNAGLRGHPARHLLPGSGQP